MNRIDIGNSGLTGSSIVLGCMRIGALSESAAASYISTAIECGINFFDHADIYGGGNAETLFGKAYKAAGVNRDDIIIQSKCGIRSGFFDFSREHILASVDGSLKRLGTDRLDVLLLHRPDTLMEPEEVADAFETLHEAGKVLHFGVSNQNPGQMKLLEKYMSRNLIINQLQFGPANTGMIDAGLCVNMEWDTSVNRDGGILEYCRLKDITIQAWSPFQYGFFDGSYIGSDKYKPLNEVLDRIGGEYSVTATTVAAAWILRHPAKMQLVAGTTKETRLREICDAARITLTRRQWYEIYCAAGNRLP
jgi:predicted oxidoreductase